MAAPVLAIRAVVAGRAIGPEQDLSFGRALLTVHAPEQRPLPHHSSDRTSELAFGDRKVNIVYRRDPPKAACGPRVSGVGLGVMSASRAVAR